MSRPQHMCADDPAAADPARRRLLKKSPFPRFPSFPARTSTISINTLPFLSDDHPTDDIHIDDAPLPHSPDDKDVYRWAILYENQRGITLFSTPFYSPLSLLPSDPRPFTIPHNHTTRAHHPNLSLGNYPLPDGTWRWVSGAWMIDMRTGLGEVQHDGFEYNWFFRDNHWHAKVGKLGAGAWVRRRRWVRLMMRPANHTCAHNGPTPACNGRLASKLSLVGLDHHPSRVWDGGEQDWQHVHRLLRQLGRDGRKLELWRMWLAPYVHTHAPDIKGKTKQPDPLPPSQIALEKHLSGHVPEGNPPPLVHLTTILGNHGEAILRSFVFPDSRAQFVDLVRRAGLAKDLEIRLGHSLSAADVDFWSYADNLDNPLDRGD
ncbi:hypothetical protein HD554DRAFT_1403772 [Boletus coccyginus]|nr:hypothetical protein HD554DRAFT_1403772 [Boletus coccyginus]